MAVLIIAFSLAPMSFASVAYPQGVTKELANAAMTKTDTVLKNLAQNTEGKSLSAVVQEMLFSDSTISSLTKSIYGMSEENGETFSKIGLSVTPDAVSANLVNYPDVQSRLSGATSWSTVDLKGAEWGIETVEDFADAAVAVLTPMTDLLYTILCGGSYSVNPLVGLKGAKGYANAVVRIYIKCGMSNYTPVETFEAQAAADKNSMIRNVISDLANYLSYICTAPATLISTKLPGIACFIENGGLDNAISELIAPLRLKVLGITTPIKIGSVVDLAAKGEAGTSFNFNLDLNSFSASGTLKTAPFDLSVLASLAFDDVDTYKVEVEDSFIYILRWLVETLKLNASSLPSMLNSMGNSADMAQVQQLLSSVLAKSTDELILAYMNLLSSSEGKINPYVWSFNPVASTVVSYTPNLSQEKYQRVLDGIDELINQFIKESGEAESFRQTFQPKIYSNSLLNQLVSSIYGMLNSDDMGSIIALAGIDVSTGGLAKTLTENSYSAVREALTGANSFADFKKLNVNWGFKDGNKNGFGKAFCAAFRPLEPVLRMMLCGDKIDILGAIPFYGSDGYNTAVIPVLEALGCTFEEIRTYDQFLKQTQKGDLLIPIAKALLSLIERMLDYPVYTLTGILPNLMYFLNGGGLEICIKNLLYPITDMVNSLGLSSQLNLESYTNIDTEKLVDDLIAKANLDIKIPELDLKQFGSIGTLITVQTKRTQAGQETTVQYLQSDRTGVLITLLRYLVKLMKTPGNEGIVDSFMASSGEGNEMFATYSEGIDEQLASMDTDETIEWLYKLFFRERVTVDTGDEDFIPTVIYEEKNSIDWARVAIASLLIIAALLIIAMLNRDKVAELINKLKEKKEA